MEAQLQLTNTAPEGHGLLGLVFDWIKAHASHNGNLVRLHLADLQYLASDLGVTEAELVKVLPLTNSNTTTLPSAPPDAPVLPRAADHSLLLDRMMEARGLDPNKVRHSLAAVVREMELVCTRCKATAFCRRDLQDGTANEHFHEYCHNAHVFDELPESGLKA
jgi:hypothetical protein